MEFEARRRLYEFIQANPGYHLRELQRVLDVPMTTLIYHLRALERRGLVVVKEEKYYRRFYPVKGVPPEDKPLVSALRHRHMRDIILYVLTNDGGTHREMVEALGLSPSSLSLYLRELLDRRILDRAPAPRGGRYELRNVESVVRLLQTYRRSLLDRTVDAILEVWLEQNFRPGKGAETPEPQGTDGSEEGAP